VAMSPMQSNIWERIKGSLASKVSPQDFQNWVMRTVFAGLDGKVLRVTVPDQVTKDWMEQEYGEEIHRSIQDLSLPVDTVLYFATAPATAAPQVTENGGLEPIFASASGQLNPKFRFDNYVVGKRI
jgi:chromosomal replication initiator protein